MFGYSDSHPLVKFKPTDEMKQEDLDLHYLKNEIIDKIDDYNHRYASTQS